MIKEILRNKSDLFTKLTNIKIIGNDVVGYVFDKEVCRRNELSSDYAYVYVKDQLNYIKCYVTDWFPETKIQYISKDLIPYLNKIKRIIKYINSI